MMTIQLTAQQAEIIAEEIGAGRYDSTDEALDEAIKLLVKQREAKKTGRRKLGNPFRFIAGDFKGDDVLEALKAFRETHSLGEGVTLRDLINEGRA